MVRSSPAFPSSRNCDESGSLTLAEVVFVAVIVGVLAAVLVPMLLRHTRQQRLARCTENLRQIGRGMAAYSSEYGNGGRFYPCPLGRGRKPNDFTGAEWLASLYWTGPLTDPDVFLCPSTRDTNRDGADLGQKMAPPTFGPQTVSYAGLGLQYRTLTDLNGVPMAPEITDDMPGKEPMASDDTEGTINHAGKTHGGMNVLFFDGHVEFRTRAELDPATAVGAPALPGQSHPLLWRLRN